MKITGVRCGRLRVPLKTPFKTTAHVVDAIDDAVRNHLGPILVGADVADLNRLVARVQAAMEHNSSAKAAVDVALHDLFGQRYGAPLYRLLGGGDPSITTDITISVDYIDKMIADAVSAVALKLKVGKDAVIDVERVKAVYSAIAGRALLRLDANEGWTPKQAVRAIRQLEDAGVRLDLVEQPVKAWDLSGMAYVTERVGTPIMADESIAALTDVVEVIQRRAADVVNIKLMKLGGLSRALKVADLAAMYGVECMVGCMLESAIGAAAAAHLAVARADVVTRVDLDAPSLGAFNPVSGNVTFADAEITIGDAPGLGITAIAGLEPVSP
jgi:L-alanine-DL-glutamate epimerase-like enolase superfamily enzyme